jgi:hypothetical protein
LISRAGLPDGLFSNQKSRLGKNLEGLGIENVVTFYDHLEYFTAIWHNLQPFGIVCGHLVYFSRFGMFGPRKIWQPCSPAFLEKVIISGERQELSRR